MDGVKTTVSSTVNLTAPGAARQWVTSRGCPEQSPGDSGAGRRCVKKTPGVPWVMVAGRWRDIQLGRLGMSAAGQESEKARRGGEIAPGEFDSHRNVAHNARGVYVARPSLLEMCVLRINGRGTGRGWRDQWPCMTRPAAVQAQTERGRGSNRSRDRHNAGEPSFPDRGGAGGTAGGGN